MSTVSAHVLTSLDPRLCLKQAPNFSARVENVKFTFGLRVPKQCDVIIHMDTASRSIFLGRTQVPVAFFQMEPLAVRPLKAVFLEQFDFVHTIGDIDSVKIDFTENYCARWLAGVNLDTAPLYSHLLGHDYFSALEVPDKAQKVVVVTSSKNQTEMHRLREPFLVALQDRLGGHVEIFGSGSKLVGDKRFTLLESKYVVALENSTTPNSWTEKLSDALLCWAYVFHAGCLDVAEKLPGGAFSSINIASPGEAADLIAREISFNRWESSLEDIAEARRRILDRYNLMAVLAEVAQRAHAKGPRMPRPQVLRSVGDVDEPDRVLNTLDIAKLEAGRLYSRVRYSYPVGVLTYPGKRFRRLINDRTSFRI